MISKRRAISACIAIAAGLVIIAFVAIAQNALTINQSVRPSQPDDWEEIVSTEWEFTAQLPAPVKRKKSSIATPFGDAPLDTISGSMGSVLFTVAVTQYDPRVATEFTEQERYESSARETPRSLGGELVHDALIQLGHVTGREQIIEVAEKCILHSRLFLVGDRSYQIQVVYPLRSSLDPETEKFFLNSLMIKYHAEGK